MLFGKMGYLKIAAFIPLPNRCNFKSLQYLISFNIHNKKPMFSKVWDKSFGCNILNILAFSINEQEYQIVFESRKYVVEKRYVQR